MDPSEFLAIELLRGTPSHAQRTRGVRDFLVLGRMGPTGIMDPGMARNRMNYRSRC